MEARLRILGALRIVKGTETRPSFVEPLDAGEHRDLRDFDTRMDLAAGEIWSCVEVEQQSHLEAIRHDPHRYVGQTGGCPYAKATRYAF